MDNERVEIQKGAKIKVVTQSAAKHLVGQRGWHYVNVETFEPKPSTGVVVLKGKEKVEETEEDNFDPTAEEAAADEKEAAIPEEKAEEKATTEKPKAAPKKRGRKPKK
jgi:hypothetical protein